MSLRDLLKDPTAYRVGTTGQNAASKGIDYPGGQGPLLGRRVSFDIPNDSADPTFENEYSDHGKGTIIDAYICS